MHRIVYGAFKAIIMSILLVVVLDVVFYLMRAEMLNQRIESVLVTMQQEVSKNNYLPEDSYEMYKGILVGIAKDMNGGSTDDVFVNGYRLNYNHACNSDYSDAMKSAGLTPSVKLNTPADYGDVAVIELLVSINAVSWKFDTSLEAGADQAQNYNVVREFTYTYQVPCLRYISVTK